MHRSPRGSFPSAGSLQGDSVLATGTTLLSNRKSRRSTRPSTETSQPTRTKQHTAYPTQTSPTKLSRGRVTTAGRSTEETSRSIAASQPNVTQLFPILSGNFDLYGMYLPSLSKLCLPPEATTPDYSAVYDRVLASQAKQDYTARCFLAPQDPSTSTPLHGRFESASTLDPITEQPLDILLDSFTYLTTLTFTPTERSSFRALGHSIPGPGLVGHARLSPTDGIKNAKGVFKIKRIWAEEQEGSVKELFGGFFSFSVSYDSTGRKAAHNDGSMHKFAFWGVRAMKNNTGKEIGLGPGQLI